MCWELTKTGSLRFSYSPEASVKKVCLAGNFTDWKPVAMTKQKSGQFVRIMKLPAGTHEYKFIIDGVWTHDTDHNIHIPNSLGSFNSVVVV